MAEMQFNPPHATAWSPPSEKRPASAYAEFFLANLWHAWSCPFDECDTGPSCTAFKAVWAHRSTCYSAQSPGGGGDDAEGKPCDNADCRFATAVLGHVSECSDHRCTLCLPLRREVKGGDPDASDGSPTPRSLLRPSLAGFARHLRSLHPLLRSLGGGYDGGNNAARRVGGAATGWTSDISTDSSSDGDTSMAAVRAHVGARGTRGRGTAPGAARRGGGGNKRTGRPLTRWGQGGAHASSRAGGRVGGVSRSARFTQSGEGFFLTTDQLLGHLASIKVS